MIAVILGFFIDVIVGDPKSLPHPVRWIGSFIHYLTKRLNKGAYRRVKGAIASVLTIVVTGGVVAAIVSVSYLWHPLVGIFVEALLIGIGLAQKSLKQAALQVYAPLVNADVEEARHKLSWIVGRDTMHLEEPEIVRGVVETVSENTSDGVTAPLFYGFLFGATGLWCYKAINTLDSMIGYQNEKYASFGYFAAKLDDVVNWIPSRITGLCLLLCTHNESGYSLPKRLRLWQRDAKKHPSPNGGYLEAATALQLGIQLGGVNHYEGVESYRAIMGEKQRELTPQDIKKTIRQMHQASVAILIIGSMTGGILYYVT